MRAPLLCLGICLACSDPAPAAEVAVAEGRPPSSLAPAGSAAPAQVELPGGPRAAQASAPRDPHAGDAPHGGAAPHAGAAPAVPGAPGAAALDPDAPVLAGVRWQTPPAFTFRRPSMPMRAAEYVVAGDAGDALMTVFHFPGMGGDVDGNVGRWVGQFTVAGAEEPELYRATRDGGGLEVHLIDIRGTYVNSMTQTPPTADTRLLGAIVLGPQGPVFFKLVGPAATVAAAEEAFEAFAGSLSPAA